MTRPPLYRWIHEEKARYYQAHLVSDLFGDWTLITAWGALGSHRGGMHSTGVPSYEAGLARLDGIARRRRQRGYERLTIGDRSGAGSGVQNPPG